MEPGGTFAKQGFFLATGDFIGSTVFLEGGFTVDAITALSLCDMLNCGSHFMTGSTSCGINSVAAPNTRCQNSKGAHELKKAGDANLPFTLSVIKPPPIFPLVTPCSFTVGLC